MLRYQFYPGHLWITTMRKIYGLYKQNVTAPILPWTFMEPRFYGTENVAFQQNVIAWQQFINPIWKDQQHT